MELNKDYVKVSNAKWDLEREISKVLGADHIVIERSIQNWIICEQPILQDNPYNLIYDNYVRWCAEHEFITVTKYKLIDRLKAINVI